MQVCAHLCTCSSVLRSPNSRKNSVSEGNCAGSKKCNRLNNSSTVFCKGVPVKSTLCSCNWKERWLTGSSLSFGNYPFEKESIVHCLLYTSQYCVQCTVAKFWKVEKAVLSCSKEGWFYFQKVTGHQKNLNSKIKYQIIW